MDLSCIKDWESLMTTLALTFGGLFFLWKLIAGWLVANLDVIIELDRQKKNSKEDWLNVTVLLKKGLTDAIKLRDVSLRIYDMSGTAIGKKHTFDALRRREVTDHKIDWEKGLAKKTFSISPGETFQYGKIIPISSGEPVTVEVCVFGTRFLWKGGALWRSTSCSLPIDKQSKPIKD